MRASAPDVLDTRAEAYAANLPLVIVATRVTPVVYLRWPETPTDVPLRGEDVGHLLQRHRGDRAALRRVFLPDGYLFHDDPQVARAMVEALTLNTLFHAPSIYRDRDGRVERLVRHSSGNYVDIRGARANLFLNDRVAEHRVELAVPRHVSLEAVRREADANRVIPFATGAGYVAVHLVFSNSAHFDALVSQQGRVECMTGDPLQQAAARAAGAEFHQWHAGVVAAARAFVRESPRFDEPANEPEGVQEDGALRGVWQEAYRQRQPRFRYHNVEYPVYTRDGHVLPPQNCVDFVLDTWERSGHTWYRPRGQPSGRDVGAVDFNRWAGLPRRNIAPLLHYINAREKTPFERYDIPAEHQVPLSAGEEFARAVAQEADAFREGDALIIYGLRPQDQKDHYHSMLVIAVDPWTGVPSVVADNQGRPRVGTLTQAMSAAPLRSIQHRIRFYPEALPRGHR